MRLGMRVGHPPPPPAQLQCFIQTHFQAYTVDLSDGTMARVKITCLDLCIWESKANCTDEDLFKVIQDFLWSQAWGQVLQYFKHFRASWQVYLCERKKMSEDENDQLWSVRSKVPVLDVV